MDLDEAAAAYEHEHSKYGSVSPETQYNLAYCLLRTEKPMDALKALRLLQGLQASGFQRDVRLQIARAYLTVSLFDDSSRILDELLAENPNNQGALELRQQHKLKQREADRFAMLTLGSVLAVGLSVYFGVKKLL
eukprot:m.145528 g.145528  ORF g.145528 m.145528 type:complete len:135 (-) comp10079_c1_seq2:1563-1967(-)